MICPNCNCATDGGHHHDRDCLLALLDWRKEAEARLIRYEELSTEREEVINQCGKVMCLCCMATAHTTAQHEEAAR